MKYYIAIDAGGTKTDSVLFDQEGHVLARDLRRGANAFDLGPMEAAARISGAVEMLQERLSEDAKISGVYGAVSAAHYYPEIARAGSRAAGGAPCQFNGVVYNVMAAVLGREDGICMISGTGSYVAARKGDAPMLYLGSSGYMLDTGGSGYALGRAALIASQREREGRGPKTLLTEIVERDMGETLIDHLPAIYAGGRAYVSSFAYAVFEACVQGDPQAKAIFQEGVDYFADALKHACAYLDKPCVVALGGGIFLHYPSYVNALRCQAPAGCEFRLLDAPAVYGSALEAMWRDGQQTGPAFREQFLRTYEALSTRRGTSYA